MTLMRTLLLVLLWPLALVAQSPSSQSRTTLEECYAPFYHGVASGDPLKNAVIIWTRVTPDELPAGDVTVNWRMALDPDMTTVVKSGSIATNEGKDFTVKVDVTGLIPNTWFYYDFETEGQFSVVGRTRTAPNGGVPNARFAVVSCANYEDGWFNAYRHMLDRNDFDAVIHLGDYIYEYESGEYSRDIPGRNHEPFNELAELEDYRMRYSHYRLDTDLRDLHQQYPFIVVWDDHEFANDAYIDGAENHQPATEGSWADRTEAAKQAYFEWLPIRENPDDPDRIYREFKWGKLLDLFMLDTRIEARELQPNLLFGDLDAPGRDLLGDTQFDWLVNNLKSSNAAWKLIGNQVMMAPIEVFGLPVYTDMWDGYQFERRSLFDSIIENNIQNVVVLTGDFHTSWANDLPTDSYDLDAKTGSAGVEFAAQSITSNNFDLDIFEWWAGVFNDHIRYTDFDRHGYILLDVRKKQTRAEWWYVNTVDIPSDEAYLGQAWFTKRNQPFLKKSNSTLSAPVIDAPFGGDCPVGAAERTDSPMGKEVIVFGAYPNPVRDYLSLQAYIPEAGDVSISIFDLNGKEVYRWVTEINEPGLVYNQADLGQMEAGTYLVSIRSDNYIKSLTISKQ